MATSRGNRGWLKIPAKLRTWSRLGTKMNLLILEATFWLGLYRVLILLFPFRWFAPKDPPTVCDDVNPARTMYIGKAVLIAARNVPWQAACLAQALAARSMLRLRKQPSAVHLGARIDQSGELAAHAWLTCGETTVTGGRGLAGFTWLITLN